MKLTWHKKMKAIAFACFLLVSGSSFSQTVTYQNIEVLDTAETRLLKVDQELKLDYLKNTVAPESRPVGVNPFGVIQLLDPSAIQVYRVQNPLDIATIDAATNSIIHTASGAKYVVQNDSIAGYTNDNIVAVPLNNGKFAILQTRGGGFYIEDFGAIPNDGIDDSEEIQMCIDAVIKLKLTTSKVNAGPGTFNLETGVVIARYKADPVPNKSKYLDVTLTLSGSIPVYDNNPSIGSTTVFQLNPSSFTLAVQKGRNCLIENIFFIGSATVYQNFTPKQLIENSKDDWTTNVGIRGNLNSPDCAIAIDPFVASVAPANRYPGHEHRYNSYNSGGTSMLTIRGCGFRYHHIGIANNPSTGVQNGDNIRAEHCRAANLHTFWASGQTQARANSIDNVYSVFVNRFVDCNSIGTQVGTPPSVTNCNLAGITKEFVYMTQTGRSTARFSNNYMESLFAIGTINANSVSFHQCHIKFIMPDNTYGVLQPAYHLAGGTVVSFVDCGLEYYSSSSAVRPPFRFLTRGVHFSGGDIQGGMVLNGATTSSELEQVQFKNVKLLNANGEVGMPIIGGQFDRMNYRYMEGGQTFKINADGWHIFENKGTLYNHKRIEKFNAYFDNSKRKIHLVPLTPNATLPGQFQLGDNLLAHPLANGGGIINDTLVLNMGNNTSYKSGFGYVSDIRNDTIEVSGVPYGFREGSLAVDIVHYPVFIGPMWGDLEAGSNVVTNVRVPSAVSLKKLVGKKVYGKGILNGTYVTAVDDIGAKIYLSTDATLTLAHEYIYNAKFEQTVYRKSTQWPPVGTGVPYIKGSRIILENILPTIYGYFTTDGGINNVSPPLSFGVLTY